MKRLDAYRVPGSEDQDGDPLIVYPVAPTWRDAWAILRGRYEPKVYVQRPVSLKKMNRMLKETYASDALSEQLYQPNPLLDMFKGREGKIPLKRQSE